MTTLAGTAAKTDDMRVLEIPTPRWTTNDAVFYSIDGPDNVPATLQDRAYISPIWYTPGSRGDSGMHALMEPPRWSQALAACAIGSVATCWTIDRVVGV